MQTEYIDLVKVCANRGELLMKQASANGTIEPLYLYHRPSVQGEGSGELLLVRDSDKAPEGFILTTGEGLRLDVPYDSYFQWVHDRARRAPILAH